MHEASHAVVAVLLGMSAHAALEPDHPTCGTCDIDAPPGEAGTERLLMALVAGGEGEGRSLGQPRRWHASTEDAKAILRLVGGITDESAARLSRAKASAAKLVRDPRAWRAIEEVAAMLRERRAVSDAAVRQAVAAAGLEPEDASD